MGLDMYLYKKNHLTEAQETALKEAKAMEKAYDELYEDEKNASNRILWGQKAMEWHEKVNSIKEKTEAHYWRKANAIHAWFERYLQEEQDISEIEDCAEYAIDTECLEKLVEDCKKVLATKGTDEFEETAKRILPTQDGFFFGTTEYGDWYVQDLQDTATELASILTNSDEDDVFVYMAWW